jgi:hypothetical protein
LSYVIAAPEMMTAAATDLATIGSDLHAAHASVSVATVALAPAAADEVSVGVAALFSSYAQGFHALVGQASVFGHQFAHQLHTGAGSYASAEALNVSYLIDLLQNAGLRVAVGELVKELGINALLGPIPNVLGAIAAIVGGGALLLFLLAAWAVDWVITTLGSLGL